MSVKKFKSEKAYSKADLEVALQKIKEGMAIKLAARTFNIPRGTLQNRVHNRTKQSINSSGPPPVLSYKEEDDIVYWLNENARKGFPRRESDLLYVVKEFLDANPRDNPFTDNVPGRTWYKRFRRRHPNISVRTPEGVSDASSKVSETDIRGWFKKVSDYFEANELMSVLDDPTRVFNGDETNFQICPKTGNVLAPKGMKNCYEIERGKAKENVTVLFTFSAAGQVITPLIVYPYKRIPNDIRLSVPDGYAMDKSDKGWMTQDVFYDYIKNVFYPDLVEKKVKFPVVLFVDGHKSHLSYKLSQLCTELQIVLVCLYPNATRILQPCDVSIFKPVKFGWSDAITIWRRTNIDTILTKVRVAPILKIVIDNFLKTSSIENGFRACGLFPFSADAVDYSKCLGKNSTKKIMESEKIETTINVDLTSDVNLTSFTNVINMKRFKELVGENKLKSLNQFDNSQPCSSDFSLLHKVFQELCAPNREDTSTSTSYDAKNCSSEADVQVLNPVTSVEQPSSLTIEYFETDEFNDFNYGQIVNMEDVVVADPMLLTDLLIVPRTPERKRKRNMDKLKRDFIVSSELWKMEEQIIIDKKEAELKELEERKRKRVENTAKKLQVVEAKRLENNKKTAERQEKIRKITIEKEEKSKKKAAEQKEKKEEIERKKEEKKRQTEENKRRKEGNDRKKRKISKTNQKVASPPTCGTFHQTSW